MKLRATIVVEWEVPDDAERRAEAYGGATTDEDVIAAERSYIEDDGGYLFELMASGDADHAIHVQESPADGRSAREREEGADA